MSIFGLLDVLKGFFLLFEMLAFENIFDGLKFLDYFPEPIIPLFFELFSSVAIEVYNLSFDSFPAVS